MSELIVAGDAALEPATDPRVALDAVASVPPGDDALEVDRLVIAHLVSTQENAARRDCRPGHLTGSALVLDSTGATMLALLHAKLGRWLQPGGHADGNTNLAAVALREATEETGIDGLAIDPVPIDLDIHRVDPPGEGAHLHLDVRYLVIAPRHAVVAINDESRDARWVAVDDLDPIDPDESLRRMVSTGRRRWSDGRTQTSPGV